MSKHDTQKSFKSKSRDKPKHSVVNLLKNRGGPKKGGAGARNWGKPGVDELKPLPVVKNDLSSDDPEDEKTFAYQYAESDWAPEKTTQHRFVSTVEDLTKFKQSVRKLLEEFLASGDQQKFDDQLKALNMPLFHQDIPYLFLRTSFTLTPQESGRVDHLLLSLFKNDTLSSHQITAAVRKLYNQIHDLQLDVPNIRHLLKEFVGFAVAAGMMAKKTADEIETSASFLNDEKQVNALKQKIASIVNEYFRCEEFEDFRISIKELDCTHLHYEIVKKLISTSFDHSNRERELACLAVAALTGDLITQDDVQKAYNILLERVEDLYLDVPDVLRLLSCFLARAVVDEALPPAFLARVDLHGADMGFQVVKQAQVLLEQKHAAHKLHTVWGVNLWDEEDAE